MASAAYASRGPEFEAAMKVLAEKGKPQGVMRTWYCDECSKAAGKHVIHVEKGRAGCSTCPHYERRIGVTW